MPVASDSGTSLLTIFHVAGPEAHVPWSEFPSVRGMLEGWGLLPPGSPKDAVPALGIEVEKIAAHDDDVVRASLDYLAGFPAQLVVLSTHGVEGLPRWFAPAVAEPLARATRAHTLFVPHGARGFVAPDDGRVSLGQVLVPVDAEVAGRVGAGDVVVGLVRAGDPVVGSAHEVGRASCRERV